MFHFESEPTRPNAMEKGTDRTQNRNANQNAHIMSRIAAQQPNTRGKKKPIKRVYVVLAMNQNENKIEEEWNGAGKHTTATTTKLK